MGQKRHAWKSVSQEEEFEKNSVKAKTKHKKIT